LFFKVTAENYTKAILSFALPFSGENFVRVYVMYGEIVLIQLPNVFLGPDLLGVYYRALTAGEPP